ncbi:phage major capsid protein [Croceicoccus gelatinilyticus]|uniref:phage major capsid protein n=1 Tax=Croceicoccus gelatinilyticus TaxID=2835536 RepID=UPI001CEC4EEF|nr:phage major capsid protein [Croceicoccus gelatinilyticus]
MPKLSDLLEQRTAAHDRMKAADAKGDDEAFKTAETEWRDLGPKIERAKAIDNAERLEAGAPVHGQGSDPALSRELRQFSIVKMMAHKAGMDVDAGREIEMQAELAKRAGKAAQGFYVPTEVFEQRVGTTTTASGIVADSFRPDLYTSALTNKAVVSQMGATVLTSLTGDVVLPRETDSPAVGWVAENAALSSDDGAFDTVTLTPHHVGAISEFSRQLMMQGSPDIERLLRSMLARNIALEIDRAAINGSGSGAEPAGILQTAGIGSEAFATDLFTTTAEMIATADLANVENTRAFLGTNGIKKTAMLALDTTDRPLGEDVVFHGEARRFTNQAPSNLGVGTDEHALIYGDWSDLLIGVWSQLDILVNPYAETAYSKGNVLVRAMATVDFGVRRPASFVEATGITVS